MAKEKKPHTLLVVRYEPTVKDCTELLAKDNMSQTAIMYRALESAKGPLTVKEIYAACEGKCESGAAYERLGKNLNSSLFALRKAGFVKKSEKPRLPTAPRSPKGLRPASPALRGSPSLRMLTRRKHR